MTRHVAIRTPKQPGVEQTAPQRVWTTGIAAAGGSGNAERQISVTNVEIVTLRASCSFQRLTFRSAVCSNRQMLEPRILAVAENLLRALRFFGQARSAGEILDLPGVSIIICGLNYAAFNASLVARPIDGDPRELARLIDVSAREFDARHVRWTCWVCEHFLGQPLLRDAQRIFTRHGLRPLTEAPGMYAERLLPPQRELPKLEVVTVNDERTRSAFAHIMSVAFDIPRSICTSIYGSEHAWMGAFRGYVGYANGKPVTTAATMITGDVIGLYSVATLPQHRRLGFAEVIMRHVIEQHKRSSGSERSILQATPSGISLYQKMGYQTVTNFNVYITD
jgi:GNAT superfamily N-acetyltransferase